MKKIYHQSKLTPPSGPYTPAIEVQTNGIHFLYISGQGPRDPKTGKKYLGDIRKQTSITMDNLKRIIEDAGFTMEHIIKVTIYVTDMDDYRFVNEVYETYFLNGKYPTRSTVAVKQLPNSQDIEIEAIAVK